MKTIKKEETMKEKKEKKLNLNKITIQDLDFVLDRVEQNEVRGGSGGETAPGTTKIPVIC
jgi:hypothetical protein